MSLHETPARIGDRSLFPDLGLVAYLNHAAIAPVCRPVAHAVRQVLDDYASRGSLAFSEWAAQRERLRGDLARLIGAQPDEIALGFNTTRGVTDVALSIPWRSGDRVVLFNGEFPANVTPWQRAAELFELELVFLDANDFATDQGLDQLNDELERGVRLVALSSVQFQTGLAMPVVEIGTACRQHGAELFVDAIQGAGVLPFNVEKAHVDYLSSGGHKWLLGVEGAAFTYVRRDRAAQLRPYTAGWLSHQDAELFLFEGANHLRYDRPLKPTVDVFETGTASLLSVAGLGASVPLLLELDVARIFTHVQRYHDALEPLLIERGFQSLRATNPERRSGILSFNVPEGVNLKQLAVALRARGVAPGTPDGRLRFAPHFANSLDEISGVVTALDDALKSAV